MAALVSLLVLLLPLIAGAAPKAPRDQEQPPCAVYDDETVRVSGVIELRRYPGLPGDGEKGGGEQETVWILRLFQPICATGEIDEDEAGVRELQVAVSPELFHAIASVAGKPVTVTGSLFHAHGGHHHTAVLIWLTDLATHGRAGPLSGKRGPALRAALDPPARAPITAPLA